MNQISLTLPMDFNALSRAADMLRDLAADLGAPKPVTAEAAISPLADPALAASLEQITQAEVDAGNLPDPKAGGGQSSETPVLIVPSVTEPATLGQTQTSAPAGVELAKDSTGAMIPWDERIHSGGDKRTKADGSWKLKRGIDAALVQTVEAELRAAMAIPGPNAAAEPAPVVASAATTPVIVPTVEPVVTPVVQPASGAITTLPALMQAATAAGKTPTDMQAAATACGLASVVLLGARPDLIPTAALALGLGG